MNDFSYSKLNTFQNCPYQFKLKYIDKVRVDKRETIEAFMGSRVHEVLEKIYKDLLKEKHNSLEDLLKFYDEVWDKNYTNEIRVINQEYSAENYKEVGRRCIKDYYARYHPFNQGKTLGTELRINFKLDKESGIFITGIIDRLVEVKDGYYEIHDYKTSGHLPSQAEKDEDKQLALYQLWLKENFKYVKGVKLVWHFLVFDKEIVSRRNLMELRELKNLICQQVAEIHKAIEGGEFEAEESALCDWCEYADLCPKKKHLWKVKDLPVNEFLKEDGVTLVNKYAENELLKDKYEEQKAKLVEAILALAKKNNYEVIVGSDHQLRIKFIKGWKFPTKSDPNRVALEKIINESGLWLEVSDLNTFALKKLIDEKKLDPSLCEKIYQLCSLDESHRILLSKKKES